MTKTTKSTHPAVQRALDGVETAKAKLVAAERDLVNGLPVSSGDLASAEAGVRHAELLVQRAERIAASDDADREVAEQLAQRVSERLDALAGDPLGEIDDLRSKAVAAVQAARAAAEAQLEVVAALAGEVAEIPDHQRFGLWLQTVNTGPRLVRTADAVVIAPDPGLLVEGIFAEVSGRPVPQWQSVLDDRAQGGATAQSLTEDQRRESWVVDRERRRVEAGVADARRAEEAHQRYLAEGQVSHIGGTLPRR